jgi:hypothetical protein
MHNPANNNCPRNADPRNECCACDPVEVPAFRAAKMLYSAAKVISLTPHIAAYLAKHDRQALKQLEQAIAAAEGRQ